MHSVALRLAGALSQEEAAQIIVEEGTTEVGALTGGLWLMDSAAGCLRLMRFAGVALDARFEELSLDRDAPLVDAVHKGEPIFLEGPDDYVARYPASMKRIKPILPEPMAVACLPVMLEQNVFGGLVFAFAGPRSFDPDERQFLVSLAQYCAHALERARLYREQVRAVTVRDDFLSIAGHELRTPLTPIVLESQALARLAGEVGVAVLQQRAHNLTEHVERLTAFVEQLLDVSRIIGGQLEIRPRQVDLAELIHSVVARARQLGDDVRDIDLYAAEPVVCTCDAMRIEQVLSNVVGNAIKYGSGRPVTVTVTADAGHARVVVTDRGIGIDPADHGRIFERFERAVSSRHFGGLGLGLWIAAEIVRGHGGAISVESELGQGATFTVRLPLAPGQR